MNEWKKQRNYRKYQNEDGSRAYVIYVDAGEVQVSEAIYREYAALARKMEYMERDLKQ